MAEGGRSIKESDVFYDYNCTDCLNRKDIYTEAILYCPECNKYQCKPCWVCAHDVIGRGNIDKLGKPSKRLQFDPCPGHKANVIQLYCKKHDVVCCPVCGQTDHKPCGELQYIPLVASAHGNTASLKTVKKNLQELQTKADKLGKDRTSRLAGLDNTEQQMVAAVMEFRSKMDALLDDLQQQSLDDIKQHMSMLRDRYKNELADFDTIKTEMVNLQQKLDAASKDETLMFSRLKQGIKQVEDKSHLISDIAKSEIPDKAQFEPHTNLEQQVKSLQGLGTLLTDPLVDQIQISGLGKVKRSQGQGLHHVPLNQPYTVKHNTSLSLKVSKDKHTCNIYGMCQMPDGRIIVADHTNKSLKQLDSKYKVTSHCSLTACPTDVCPTGADQVAVANGKAIQFVSVGAKMTRTKSFSTDHDCDRLTYSNNCLFVVESRGTSIHVYNLSGTHIRTIRTDQHGNKLFNRPRCITASFDGARLYITDNKTLITIDTEGNLLATFNSKNLKEGGFAVCVDRADNVFVGGNASQNVLQVEKGEKQVAEVVSPSDGLTVDRLCFDGVNLRLLVCASFSDTVRVLHFQSTIESLRNNKMYSIWPYKEHLSHV